MHPNAYISRRLKIKLLLKLSSCFLSHNLTNLCLAAASAAEARTNRLNFFNTVFKHCQLDSELQSIYVSQCVLGSLQNGQQILEVYNGISHTTRFTLYCNFFQTGFHHQCWTKPLHRNSLCMCLNLLYHCVWLI